MRLLVTGCAAVALGLAALAPPAAPAAPQDTACALDALAATTTATAATPEIREIAEAQPAWLTTELVDACSGETFALADFAGTTVFVHPMATW